MQERDEAQQDSAKGSANGQSANGNGTSTSALARERRERRIRENPVLVKPSQPAPDAVDAAIAEATSQTQLPEDEIARTASSTPKSSNGNGATNGNGAIQRQTAALST